MVGGRDGGWGARCGAIFLHLGAVTLLGDTQTPVVGFLIRRFALLLFFAHGNSQLVLIGRLYPDGLAGFCVTALPGVVARRRYGVGELRMRLGLSSEAYFRSRNQVDELNQLLSEKSKRR